MLVRPELGKGNSAPRAIFGSVYMAHAVNWRAAYRIALVNAGVFLALAFVMFVLEPKSLVVILSAPAVFFLGGIFSSFLLMRNGGDLAAIAWFVLGSSIYFGFGAVAGGLHVHPHSDYLFGADTLYLIHVNLLNACSVFVVLVVAYPLANMRSLKAGQPDISPVDIERSLQRVFQYIAVIAAIGVGLKYAMFPVADSLVLRSMATKIYLILPCCFLLLGLLWRSIRWQLRLFAGSVWLLEILNGLIALTKYQIIIAVLAFIVGMGMTKRSAVFLASSFMMVAAIFAIIVPLVTLGRAHIDYDAHNNTVETRLTIIADAVDAYYLDDGWRAGTSVGRERFKSGSSEKFTMNIEWMTANEARLRALGRRFDVASIQGYLVNEYNSGRPGNSLADILAVVVPRVLWPEKPIITRFGVELNEQYYHYPNRKLQSGSSTAPTYSGEAYWNYGVPGVVLVSILLGLAVGWLTRCWHYAMLGRDPAFLLIAFPAAIWVSFVESWLVATYLGEFVIFVVILLCARASFVMMRAFTKSKTSVLAGRDF